MNRLSLKYFILIVHIFYSGVFFSEEVHYELVTAPKSQDYRALFFAFGHSGCGSSYDDVSVLDALLSQEFEQEFEVYNHQPDNIALLQAIVLDEVVGYFSCEMVQSAQFLIRQMAFDVDRYGDSLLKDFLLAIFEAMPNIEKISVVCPMACKSLTDFLYDFDFVAMDPSKNHLSGTFSLLVHSKCGMCQVLYGDDFWDQDEDAMIKESDVDEDSDFVDRSIKDGNSSFIDEK